jgi:hypothetical protein
VFIKRYKSGTVSIVWEYGSSSGVNQTMTKTLIIIGARIADFVPASMANERVSDAYMAAVQKGPHKIFDKYYITKELTS